MNITTSIDKKNGNRTIVLAGGEARDVLSLSLLLQRFAYKVSIAHTASQALTLIKSTLPALVIAEPFLAGADRTDLLHVLMHQDRDVASIPVIYMLFRGDTEMEQKCIDSGASGCILKPVQAEELFQAVQASIEPKPRANIRIDTRLPVSLDNVPLACSGGEGGCTIDLSEQGMYVPMSSPYPPNKRLKVRISIKERTISAESRVAYSHPPGAGLNREPGMGLNFIALASQDQEFIRKFIHDEVMRDVSAAMSRA
jgi:CheY-like chemotaxis protein